MTNSEPVVTVEKPLLERVEQVAVEMRVSTSHIVALALEQYLRRRENQALLEQMDQACAKGAETAEPSSRGALRRHHRRIVEGE